jgi:acetyl-CoA carboxylase biotin carboxyl carrier protein
MDIRKIKTLIDMLENSNLNEIEVSQGDESVRISKGNGNIDIEKTNQNQVTDTKANEVK